MIDTLTVGRSRDWNPLTYVISHKSHLCLVLMSLNSLLVVSLDEIK